MILPSYKQFKSREGSRYKSKLRSMGANIDVIGPPTSWIQYINPNILLKSLEKIIEENIDYIICDYPWSGIYTLILNKITKVPFFLMEHNVEYEVAEQTEYESPELTKTLEKKVCKKSKRVFCVSKRDKKKISKEFDIEKNRISVMKNGFNADIFNPENGNGHKIRDKLGIGDEPLIFFCGKMDYIPNSEAVGLIYHEIMPRVLEKIPEAKFLIVGGGYELDYKHDSMIFTGVVDRIVDYLKASDFVITPLRRGGGTRIKVLEAIACGKDVISTPKGVEGLLNKYTEPFISVENDWNDFADRLVDKIKKREDPVPRKEFFEKYAWKNIFEKIDDYI
ncbi:MAG: glycosyltransferase family 4 protein, partial [Candidatus Aenigmatarchaeota archaeon]